MSSCNPKKPATFKEFIFSKSFLKPLTGIILGAAGGFLYYYFVGCSSGSCAITGNPFMSTITGGFLGFIALNSPCQRC